MDLISQLNAIVLKVRCQEKLITSEAATKAVCVVPFIEALGYDTSNLEEVDPEFGADIGKKGEKVDYAIKIDGKCAIIIECKILNSKLDAHNQYQLHRYFHASTARIGILTDGIVYKFYTDLEEPNKMDNKPFLEFSMRHLDDNIISVVNKFSKQSFNLHDILSVAKTKTTTPSFDDALDIFKIKTELTVKTEEFENYHEQASQGNMLAQYELGLMYQLGKNTDRNYKKAIKWYTKSAEQNHVNAQVNLARMFYDMSPLDTNYHAALKWFSKAAEQGNAEAQYYLGKMYQHGHGIDCNLNLAEYWYIKALENSDDAMKKRVIKACLAR